MNTYFDLVVIIPALNEEKTIGMTIDEINQVLGNPTIIVVNNNSSDSTATVAKQKGAKVIFEPSPGKGRAFRAALAHLPKGFSSVFMVDGDCTYEIAPILDALQDIHRFGVDLVVGKRVLTNNNIKFRKGHKFGNKIFSFINKVLHSSEIEDSLSGWRLMSREFIYTFPAFSKGFELETELNAHARNFDMTISNINVEYRNRIGDSVSKLSTYKDGIRILISNVKIALRNRPLAFISAPSLFFLTLSMPLIYRPVSMYLKFGTVPTIPSLIVGMNLLIGGITFITIGYLIEEQRRNYIAITRQNYYFKFITDQ